MRKLKLGNKKGIADTIVILVTLFSLAITIIVAIYLSSELKTRLTPVLNEQDPSNVSTTALNNTLDAGMKYYDIIFVSMFVISVLGMVITSFLFYAHPVFVVIYIILSIGSIISSVFVSNIFETISSNSVFVSSLSSIPMTVWIVQNLPLLTAVLVMISIIVIYAKPTSNQPI